MSKTDIIKSKLISFVKEINEQNSSCCEIKFNQQKIAKENMSVFGANGCMYINPSQVGYDVSLSGKSLEKNTYSAMKDLFSSNHDGYKQTNNNTGVITQPFWRTDNFELVKRAIYIYSKTKNKHLLL